MNKANEIIARAFNAGCDARLRGEPEFENPYAGAETPQMAYYWRQGWTDVERNWPRDVKPLPAVEQVA